MSASRIRVDQVMSLGCISGPDSDTRASSEKTQNTMVPAWRRPRTTAEISAAASAATTGANATSGHGTSVDVWVPEATTSNGTPAARPMA